MDHREIQMNKKHFSYLGEMNLDLNELTEAGIIDASTAERIQSFYQSKKSPSASSRLIQVVSIIGVCLIGLGIILIIGYNWDQIPRLWRIVISLLPLLAAQAVGCITLLRNYSTVWKESSAMAILFGVGIAMTLITQIYFLDVNMTDFLRWWIILSIPLIYIFDSSAVSIAVWIGIGWLITKSNWSADYQRVFLPLGLIIAASIPYGQKLIRKQLGHGWSWHHWVVPIVLVMFIFSLNPYNCNMTMVIYLVITGIAMDTLRLYYLPEGGILNNGYKVISFVGIWIIAFMMTFGFFWLESENKGLIQCFHDHPSIVLPLIFGGLLVFLIWIRVIKRKYTGDSEIWWIGLILILLILLGDGAGGLSKWIANVLVLFGSGRMIYRGVQKEQLSILNLGILILAIWITCRFFELDISFLWRGIVFIALGILCFSLNYVLIKKRKA